jgi:hypothetical protein
MPNVLFSSDQVDTRQNRWNSYITSMLPAATATAAAAANVQATIPLTTAKAYLAFVDVVAQCEVSAKLWRAKQHLQRRKCCCKRCCCFCCIFCFHMHRFTAKMRQVQQLMVCTQLWLLLLLLVVVLFRQHKLAAVQLVQVWCQCCYVIKTAHSAFKDGDA